MAGGWNTIPTGTHYTSQSANTANSQGISLTASSTTYAKGNWTQMNASLAADTAMIYILAGSGNSSGHRFALDIGIGSSGSEIAIINNLTFSCPQTLVSVYAFPLSIPAGTRLSARVSSDSANDTFHCNIITSADTYSTSGTATAVDTYGFDTTTNLGTKVDCGSTANTKTSYVQVTSSTTADLAGIQMFPDCQFSTGTGVNVNFMMDVAVGAAGSEVIVLPNYTFTGFYSTTSGLSIGASPYFPMQIPAGSRIAVRAQCNQTAAGNRIFGITIYGARS